MSVAHTPPGSALAGRAAAKEAVDLALPMIEKGIASRRLGESGFLYIVIMDPALGPADCGFEQAILYEYSVGDRDAWDADYAQYAREKARICWRARRSGHELRYMAPHLLRATDTGVWGGIWHEGIAVGVSGPIPGSTRRSAPASPACCARSRKRKPCRSLNAWNSASMMRPGRIRSP